MARGIALLAGVTSVDPAKYPNEWDGVSGAKGCEHDVDNMLEVISSAGKYEEIKVLKKTGEPTASAILGYIDWAASTLKSGDIFVFYYSGHGGQEDTVVSFEEPDGKDETLIVYDRKIIDNELAKCWKKFAPGVRIVMVSDSCNSGTVYYAKSIPKPRKPINFTRKIPRINAQLIHFGACRDGNESDGGLLGSAYTSRLVEVWKENDGNFSNYEQLHEAIKARMKQKGYSQEPQFNVLGRIWEDFLNSKPFSLS